MGSDLSFPEYEATNDNYKNCEILKQHIKIIEKMYDDTCKNNYVWTKENISYELNLINEELCNRFYELDYNRQKIILEQNMEIENLKNKLNKLY